jgi:2-methylcitrate dehydratase PrpD
MPWSRAARRLALELGGKGSSTVLLCGDHLDAARAAFVNGAYAHACDLDDTHVGSMHHAGASILPAVLAMAEQEDADGRALLEAAICGYEASLRIELATQPSLFQRGFMATPTCGALGAALAVEKLLNFSPKDLAGALGAAGAYAGGLAQFYHSGRCSKTRSPMLCRRRRWPRWLTWWPVSIATLVRGRSQRPS